MKYIFKLFGFLASLFADQRAENVSYYNVTGVTEIDEAIPEFWADKILVDGNRESFWGALSGGEGSMMPVIDKTGPLKEKGDTLRINVVQQLMGSGKSTGQRLKGNEEKMGVGVFTVGADIVRHAVGINRQAKKESNYDQVKMAGSLLKDWFSRKLDADVFSTIIDGTDVTTLYANSKTSLATLNGTDGDYFGPGELELIRMSLIRQGTMPLKVMKTNGRSVPIYGCVFGEVEEYRLNQNTTFINNIKESLERFRMGETHPLFQGAIGIYRNMLLYTYYSILPIPQGTSLRPETSLSATLTTTATTATLGADESPSTPDYTAFFSSSGSLQIGDEILSYSGKTNNTFTGLTRGVSSTTAVQHVPAALVTQRNISNVIGFGAQAVCRAFPEKSEPIGDNEDFGEEIGIGIRAHYGHALTIDKRRAKPNGVVVMKCFSANPGTV